jgi:hypothetical protein
MKFNTRTEAGRKAQAEYLANPRGYAAGMPIPDLSNIFNLPNRPTLPTGPLPVIEPFEPELPTQVGGIGSILPSRTITLPGGQTVQIPEINMDEVNANLAAAGITPQMPTQTFVSDTQGLPMPPPIVGTAPFDPIGGREPVDMGASPPAVTTPLPTPMSEASVSIPTKPPQTTSVPGTTSPSPGAEVLPAPVAPPAYTPPPAPREDMPFVPSVRQVATGLDPLTEQLLFGLGGEGGFIPGAMRAAEKVFFDEEGKPVVIEEQVAGFSPDQLRAQQLARQGVGIQDRFISGAESAFGQGIDALRSGFGRARGLAGEGLAATRAGVGQLQRGLGESADILRGTIGGYDQAMTDRFYNPFEDRVVQQTIDDIMEAGAKQDIAARAGDIGRGGESAFGSRARLGASERQEALGRGLAEALGGIRARGFSEAQQTGLGEFARQRAAERAAASGLAGLTGQGFGGQQALAGALTGLGGIEQQLARQQQGAQFGLGTALQGLGAQAQGASAADVASLYGMGTQQQALTQAQLDAQRRNQLQAQQAPLAQFQALAPFVSMAPAGQFQTVTDFAPPPSAMQVGIGTGLSTLGALGNLYGGG